MNVRMSGIEGDTYGSVLFEDGRATQGKQKADEVGLLRRVPGGAKQQGRTRFL